MLWPEDANLKGDDGTKIHVRRLTNISFFNNNTLVVMCKNCVETAPKLRKQGTMARKFT